MTRLADATVSWAVIGSSVAVVGEAAVPAGPRAVLHCGAAFLIVLCGRKEVHHFNVLQPSLCVGIRKVLR